MSTAGNLKHQAAVNTTADIVAGLRDDIARQLGRLVTLAGRLDDLADTRQSVGLGFMTEQARALANKQTRIDRAAARGLHPTRAHIGLKFMNPVAVLGSGQVDAPVTITAVSVAAEIRYAILEHLRRLSRPAYLRALEEEQANAEDHGLCLWPRNPIVTLSLDVDASLVVLAGRLTALLHGYTNRPRLQAMLRDLEHLEERAQDVVEGIPAKSSAPSGAETCPHCGRNTLVLHTRVPGQHAWVMRCEGTHPCECTWEWCDCHRNPIRNRHEWINSGSATHTFQSLKNLQTKRKELVILETKALDALAVIRDLHQAVQLQPWSTDCTDPTAHEDEHWVEPDNGDAGLICLACPPAAVVCSSCHEDDGEQVEWPCPTAQACDIDNTNSPDRK